MSSLRECLNTLLRGDETDSVLLERFARDRDEGAFRILVERHGPMVLNTCLRMGLKPNAAEEMLQATICVFARRANTLARTTSVGAYLYKVAVRRVLKTIEAATRRRTHEEASAKLRSTPQDILPADVLLMKREDAAILDEEIERLPEKYRKAIVHRYLERESREKAAMELKVSINTLARDLAQGKQLLAKRLARRGIEVPNRARDILLTLPVPPALPRDLLQRTVQTALTFAATGELGSAAVAAIVKEMLGVTIATNPKIFVPLLVTGLVLLGLGASWLAWRPQTANNGIHDPTTDHRLPETATAAKVIRQEGIGRAIETLPSLKVQIETTESDPVPDTPQDVGELDDGDFLQDLKELARP